MSDQYLKLIREELRTSAVNPLPPQKVSTLFQAIRRSLIKVHNLDELGKEVLYQLLRKVEGDSELLAKVRSLKVIIQNAVDEGSVDTELSKILLAVLNAEKMLLSPTTIKYGNKLIYKFNSNCNVGGRTYKTGEMALLSPRELVTAEVNNCGEPLKDPFYRHRMAREK